MREAISERSRALAFDRPREMLGTSIGLNVDLDVLKMLEEEDRGGWQAKQTIGERRTLGGAEV